MQAYQIAELIEEYVEEQLKAAVAVSASVPGLSKLRRISSSRGELSRQNTSSTLLEPPIIARVPKLLTATSEPGPGSSMSPVLSPPSTTAAAASGSIPNPDAARVLVKRSSFDLPTAAAAPGDTPRTNSLGSSASIPASTSASASAGDTKHQQALVAQLRSSLASVTRGGGSGAKAGAPGAAVRSCVGVSLQPGLSPVSGGGSVSELMTPASGHASRLALDSTSPPSPQLNNPPTSPPASRPINSSAPLAAAEKCALANETDASQDSGRATIVASSANDHKSAPQTQQQQQQEQHPEQSSAGSVATAARPSLPDSLLDTKRALDVQLHDCELNEML